MDGKKAGANPTKSFFVSMITRDITLEDCILDLIDNSVDGAWRTEGSRPMGLDQDTDLSPYLIRITATPEKFSISDNCGGMALDEAVAHAFSFGRKPDDEADNFSIGIYGIGMKRAVFKLGNQINVRSTFTDDNGERLSFAVPIDVPKWLVNQELPWDFDIDDDEALPDNGVEINVQNLHEGTATSFGNPAFIQNLRRIIGRDYSFHLHRGLRIDLNGKSIQGWQIELLQSEDFQPVRVSYEDAAGGAVSVEVIGGMAAPPPDSTEPDAEDEGERRFGWYVVCNGRIVLAADKTALSGWGEELPNWHRQYSGFIGLVFFTAENAGSLPLTTTKRSVDTTSEVYRRARPKMREVTRAWIDYTNARKLAIDEAKEKERSAKPIAIYSLPKTSAVTLPVIVKKQSAPVGNILYAVPLDKLKRLARALGNSNMAYKDVGLKSFDYTYDDLVGDE